jgi:hypothetical protein
MADSTISGLGAAGSVAATAMLPMQAVGSSVAQKATVANIVAAGSTGADFSAATRTATGTTQARTYAAAASDEIRLVDFSGVDVTGATDSYAAINAWWAVVNSTGKEGILPAGTIKSASPLTLGISRNGGVRVRGPSIGGCVIDVQSAAATADGAAQFLLTGNVNPLFYSEFRGFTVLGNNTTGPMARLGVSALTDEFNGFKFDQIEFKNVANNSAAIACELNGLYNCDFQGVVTNTGGGRTNGTSLRLRRATFNRFFGSFSGAGVGILFDNSYNFANAFIAVDVEECGVAVRCTGSNNSNNVFIGGTFVATTVLDFQTSSGANNLFVGSNLSPYSGGSVGTNFNGMTVIGAGGTTIGGPLYTPGLYVVRPPGTAARVTLDSETGNVSDTWLLNNNVSAWLYGLDVSGNFRIARYNTSGAYQEDTLSITRGTGVTQWSKPIGLANYAKASLPSVTPQGQMIYVTDDAGGATPAFSDGTNWRRVADRAVIA